MSDELTVVAAVGALGLGWLVFHFGRGFRQQQRESARADLMAASHVKDGVKTLSGLLEGRPVLAFVPPFAAGRSVPIGWLWLRAERDDEGAVVHRDGWALTYAGARRAAGAELRMRRTEPEYMFHL
ncbi:hypothetical protein [Streptomyces sp. XY431]|uniref:hypothetical protein n=1 Tax=Streptomyces sp. XY431 TaxID=1415562 RepID=UPI0013314DDF|nr:hypothetical protein [Streptomyces sp. XY431]